MKKYLVYYNENEELIGIREHMFDWEEGQEILSNGRKVVIFAIFDGTPENIRIANIMMATLKKYSNNTKTRLVEKNGQLGFRTTGKVWKSFDAELDYVEEMVNSMN